MAEMRTKYDVEKKQKENEILQQKSALDQAKLERNEATRNKQSVIIYSILGLVLLFVVLLVVMFRSNVQRKKTNVQLTEQNAQIVLQKNIIEEKNKDITDSISYAKRIQEAILPPDKIIRQFLNESFVLYRPKDIVSGDFYWMNPRNNKVLFAVVDCTGHGVPGAFVSIVGHNNLNRTVKEYNLVSPAAILDKLNELVEETFESSEASVADGMDISLCALDLDTHILEWAGANNPLWIISKEGQFTEIKADKQPIGKYVDRKPFTNHQIPLKKGDTIYIFTDGYADQFGGPSGKKFKYSQLKDILISVKHLPMEKQKQFIHGKLDEWRGELEQVDDVCIIGMKV
jgi:serine phosphatase RsbU (regulator of sigma subunit)